MKNYYVIRINANGHLEKIPSPKHVVDYSFLKAYAPSAWTFGFDTVYCASGMVILCDDCGMLRDEPKVNITASFIARQNIYGDVLLFDHSEYGKLYAFDFDMKLW